MRGPLGLAYATEGSTNRKTGPIATTGVAQVTCPDTCPFRDNGCYAETAKMGHVTRSLNRAAERHTALEAILEEAHLVDQLKGWMPLRLHIVGDCPDDETTQILSAAAARYRTRHNAPVWTYTHAWREVDRASWGQVSVLASCETPDDVDEAHARGYAAALVVDTHPSSSRYELDGVEVIPCPQQTQPGTTCESCLLCSRDDYLRQSRRVIGFAAHGATRMIRAALKHRREAYAVV